MSGRTILYHDLDGSEQQGTWSVTTTATSITLPDAARIVTVIAPSADVIVRLGDNPAAPGSSAFAAGAVVPSGATRAFIVAPGPNRTFRVRGASGSATVTVEWRP